MKRLLILTIIIGLAGCAEQKAVSVQYANVCDIANNTKFIETEGFLDDKGSLYCSNTSSRMECGFKLLNNQGDANGFSADIAVGSAENSIDEVKSGYKKSDLKVRDSSNKIIDLSKKVKVSGTMLIVKSTSDVCLMQVKRIEQ